MGQSYNRANINGTSPMDLMHMNDNFKYLWMKVFGDIDNADISDSADINGSKLKEGSITAREISTDYLYAGKIKAEQIDGGTITGCCFKTNNTTSYLQTHDQYIDFYQDGKQRMEMGYYSDPFGTHYGVTYINPYDGSGAAMVFEGYGNISFYSGESNTAWSYFYGPVQFNKDIAVSGNATVGGSQVLTSSNYSNYISIPSGNYLPSTGSTITLNGHTLAFYSDGITYDGHTLQMNG